VVTIGFVYDTPVIGPLFVYRTPVTSCAWSRYFSERRAGEAVDETPVFFSFRALMPDVN
jgi:hypothetical protein